MGIDVKICGLRTAEALAATIRGGARWAGFVFYEKSPRFIMPEEAFKLSGQAKGAIDTVGVYVDAADALFDATADAVQWFQLHGSETPDRAAALKKRHGKKIVKAIAVRTADDIKAADAYKDVADLILFDAKPAPTASLPGGNGLSFDWHLLQGLADPEKWILSGGLDTDNLNEAIRISGATAVDVSSGVETAPGTKDTEKIARFLSCAQSLTMKEQKA